MSYGKAKVFSVLILISLVVLGMFLAGCKQEAREEKVIKIGAILPLSGLPRVGEWNKEGIDLAVTKINNEGGINGRKIQVIYEDSQADPKTGISAFNKLTQINKVNIIVSSLSSVSSALVPLAERDNIYLFATTVSIPNFANGTRYVWRYHLTGDMESKKMADFLYNEMNITKVAVLYLNDEFGVGSYKAFKKAYKGSVLIAEKYDLKTTDVKTQLTKIKERNPEAVYFIGTGNAFVNAIKQFRELEINSLCIGNSAIVVYLSQLGEYADGCYYTSAEFNPESEKPDVRSFVNSFTKKYNSTPNYVNAESYDLIFLIKEALEKNIKLDTAFKTIKTHKGVMGNVSIKENKDVSVPVEIGRIVNGLPKKVNILPN